MKTKLKVVTILGTRPEIIRLCEVLKACDQFFDHTLVHTGQNWDYALNDIFFKELELRQPDVFLACPGEDLGETMGNIIAKSYKVLRDLRPDALLILGDTNSALSAISAKRLKIPIFHMEAGNRCMDENVPEEINRRIVDHISDVNLPYTEHGRRHLIREGMNRDCVFVTGSPMAEVLERFSREIEGSEVLARLGLRERGYFVVSTHREENVDRKDSLEGLFSAISEVARRYKVPAIVSAHPRTRKKLEEFGIRYDEREIRLCEPFGFFDYVKLQKCAACVLSDSGTLSEESAILGFPGVSIRTSTERPEALDEGTVVIGGTSTRSVLTAVDIAMRVQEERRGRLRRPRDYESAAVSTKVVSLIASYTPIVKKRVWQQE